MPTLEINVPGECKLNRIAERAYLSVRVSAESSIQEEAARNATKALNALHAQFRDLSPKARDDLLSPNPPITAFNIGSITTSSRIPTDQDGQPTGPRQFSAFASLSATFRDFAKLGQIASGLFMMPFVEVHSIDWRLTDATAAELAKEARKKALLDAIEKASDFAQTVNREVFPVEINDRGEYSPPYGTPRIRTMMARVDDPGSSGHALDLEPQEITVRASIMAKFATAAW
ncbi:hypothetical protein EMPG_17679 [Blastomyces silverae]|uniref:DUF541 domain-containing protein n=1 Tax=Blastomyces silverae TaxID=2060906 RepID=A0A0H1B786_9EURO|nr:hypothetical protein EMPG_17679 [Blastomyces silverae]